MRMNTNDHPLADRDASEHGLAARRRVLLCLAIGAALSASTPTAMAAAAAAASSSASASPADASAESVDFDTSYLSGSDKNVDISRFERGSIVPPGIYNADVYLNNSRIGRRDLRFATPPGKASAVPCLDQSLYDQLGLRTVKQDPSTLAALRDPSACVNLASLIPDASMDFDMSELRLDVSVPQAYINQAARGYVDPKYWDAGVPAALLSYNVNAYRTTSDGHSQSSAYLGLNTGFNFGLWRFRQNSTATWTSASEGLPARRRWQNIQTYVQRDVPSLKAQFTLGDSYTDGQVYDSFAIRGMQLATDDRMRPDSMSGYAPVVQGVAQTNARVAIYQNGVKLYETTVAPGPFSINDLYPTGYGGNLLVTVTEANGLNHSFTVPYASITQLLRPGVTRFDASVGQLRNLSIAHEPTVAQFTMQRGFNNLLTGYAGASAFNGYANILAGAALNTRIGAVGMDISASRTQLHSMSTQSGQSLRLTYSEIIPSTHTSLTVAAYRYSTSGYLNIADAAVARDYAQRGLDAYTTALPNNLLTIDGVTIASTLTPAQLAALAGKSYRETVLGTVLSKQRSRFSLSMTQQLGQRGGSLYGNVSAISYWGNANTTQYQLGYNNSFKRLSYNVSVTRQRDELGRFDNQVMVSFSLPLGDSPHAPFFSTNFTHDSDTGAQEQASVNGSWGEDSEFNYGANASHSDASGGGNAGSINGSYRSPFAVFNASVGAGKGYSQSSATVSGAVVAHSGGVLFGQSLGDTSAIVYIPGAAGAHIGNVSGLRVNRSGYALVPYLRPFALDTITVDPKGLPLDVQLDATSAQVAPHAGAVVLVKFKTREGRSAVMRLIRTNNQPVPFGAEIHDAKGDVLGVVGQSGMVLLRGVKQNGILTAQWQDAQNQPQTCSMRYTPSSSGKKHSTGYETIQATCSTVTNGAKP